MSADLGLAHAVVESVEDACDERSSGFLGAFVGRPVFVGEGFEVGHEREASTRARPIARPRPLTCPNLGHRVGL